MPTGGRVAAPAAIEALARKGEELGFGFVAVSDHVAIPRDIRSLYPYDVSGEFDGGGECMEQLALLSFIAAHTSSMRLLPSVMVLPHRAPVLAAKMLATIDVLSSGRLIVGCGVGWMREEIEALVVVPYDERGAASDEYIRAFRELWTSDAPTFEGKYASFSELGFLPKTVQRPHPPIWVGGESPPALRRAAGLGDGWYPSGNNAGHPLDTASLMADSISTLRRHAEEAGRDPAAIDIACTAEWRDGSDAEEHPGDRALAFAGSAEQVAEGIRTFEGLGVGHMTFELDGPSLDETLERMERFAAEVMPLV